MPMMWSTGFLNPQNAKRHRNGDFVQTKRHSASDGAGLERDYLKEWIHNPTPSLHDPPGFLRENPDAHQRAERRGSTK